MCQCKLWESSVFLACFCVFSVTTFNVDSFNYAAYNGPDSQSMFGFSMALHKEGNNGWLIVGAPEAQSSFQQRVYRGGAVYKCPTNRDDGCQEVPFDPHEHVIDQTYGHQLDNKTEQWFGATVSSSGREEGSIVACAPRYTWHPIHNKRRDPVGTCYVSNALLNRFNEYAPCRTYQWGYHRQGSCQAGFSAAINSIGTRLFIGAPGSWYWQGQMYSIDAHATFLYRPELFSATYGAPGQVHQQSLEQREPVFSTSEGGIEDDDSYMGYSTIVADFMGNNNPNDESIAVGMPRGNNLKGVVIIFTWNLTDVLHFTSDQLGCYFGYTLAASDVDGDGKVDLIVGSPMYTISNNKDKFDIGRVYVFYHANSTVRGTYVANDTLDGFNSRSRFGQALASLGDINQDGYGDFAVGAPYDGVNYRGAVYIYHGSSAGVRKKFSQVIFAEDIVPNGVLSTFGFSITGGLDLDDNEYPDMAVGAYLSNQAFFFRSRPVIRVHAWVQFLTENKEIDITKTNYKLRKSQGAEVEAVKTEINFCARYYGKGIPSSIDLDLQYILDSKKLLDPRMGFVEDEGQNIRNDTIRLFVNRTKCTNETKKIEVYVRSDIRDKLTALVAEVKYWMKSGVQYVQNRNPRSPLIPVLDLNSPPSKKDTIKIYKNCGDDKVCIPNLSLEVKSIEKYMLNSNDPLELDITVSNNGEDSYESTVEVIYPEGLDYTQRVVVKAETYLPCTTEGNRTIKCDIGNPIPQDKIVHFKLRWRPIYDLNIIPTSYDFMIKVNSTNPENPNTLSDNTQNVSVGILYDYHQEVDGKSFPSTIHYSSNTYTVDISQQTSKTKTTDRLSDEVIGPAVIHVYSLTNEGKTTIEETELFFAWPAYTLSEEREDFLYLLESPQFYTSENLNIQCDPTPTFNYRDFEVITNNKTLFERYPILTDQQTKEMTSSQVMTTPPSPTAKTETSTHKINSTATGGQAKNDSKRKWGPGEDGNNYGEIKLEFVQGHESFDASRYQSLTIGGTQYYYRCLQVANNEKKPVNCDFYFSSDDLYNISIGHDNSLRECKKTLPNRKLELTDCGDFFSEGKSTIKVRISTQQNAMIGASTLYKFRGAKYYYQCLVTVNGVERSIDCEPYLSLTEVERLFTEEDGNIQRECIEMKPNGKTVVSCGDFFRNYKKIDQRGPVTLQISRGANTFSSDSHQTIIDGVYYYYRCVQIINGEELVVNCDPSIDIIKAIQLDKSVNRECWRQTADGRREQVNCDTILTSGPEQRTIKIKISQEQGLSGAGFEIGNTQYYYNCFETVNGIEKEVNCGQYYTLAEISRLFKNNYVQRECVRIVNGRKVPVDCTTFPNLERPWQQNIRNRCFLYKDGDYSPMNCGSAELLRKDRPDGFVSLCLQSVNEGRETQVSCPEVVERYQLLGQSQQWSDSQNQNYQNNRYQGSDVQNGNQNRGFQSNYHLQNYSNHSGYGHGTSHFEDRGNHLGYGTSQHSNADSTYGRSNENIYRGTGYNTNNAANADRSYGSYGETRNHGDYNSEVEGAALGGGGGLQTTFLHLDNVGTFDRNNQGSYHTEEATGKDNVPTDKPPKQGWYGRKKRQTNEKRPSNRNTTQTFTCNSLQCISITCTVKNLQNGKPLTIALRGRINARVIDQFSLVDSMNFSTMMTARVKKLPSGPSSQTLNDTEPVFSEIVTTINKIDTELKSEIVPLWVVVLSAVAGTIILLLLVFLLYKLGFFKRNRPSSSPERQPLNRNGYQHGDEVL